MPKQCLSQNKLDYGIYSKDFFEENYILELCEKPYIFLNVENMSYYVKDFCIKNLKENKVKNHLVLNKKRLVKGAFELQLVKNNKKSFFIIFGISTLPRVKTGILGISIGKYN
jgi:hypothetical protein